MGAVQRLAAVEGIKDFRSGFLTRRRSDAVSLIGFDKNAEFDRICAVDRFHGMTVSEIIREIEALRPEDQAEVVRFAYRLDAERRLTGEELSVLAERLVNAADPNEAMAVREEIVRGFYGGRSNA